ncbi:hypothetical protein [Shimia aestuarii]|nr:hypothetical protein [Shimia aestuarii]
MKESEGQNRPVFFWPDRASPYENPIPEAINGRCLNIDKDFISAAFENVFGYRILVNPKATETPYVRKSLRNAAHDGIVIEKPTKVEEGYVYQRLIDNRINDEEIEDLRLIFIGEILPQFYRRTRLTDKRFKNVDTGVYLERTLSYFAQAEIDLVGELCRKVGLDYGEVDVLRDRVDGKIYVVDVNRTPFGPPRKISRADEVAAVKMMGEFFSQTFNIEKYSRYRSESD